MKILRTRRGYTTNSSSYTEWLPPPPKNGKAGQNAPSPGSGNTSSQQNSLPASPAGSVNGMQNSTLSQTSQQAPTSGHMLGNTLFVIGIIGILLVIYLIERLTRYLRGKNKSEAVDE